MNIIEYLEEIRGIKYEERDSNLYLQFLRMENDNW